MRVDHQWKQVELQKPFIDPVVVAKALSKQQAEPSLVQLRNVDNSGSELRLQPWNDREDLHMPEIVGYMVIERGSYSLRDGIRVEAGIVEVENTNTLTSISFGQKFSAVPVVITAAVSGHEADMVAGSPRIISKDGFKYRAHTFSPRQSGDIPHSLAYVAWEPSSRASDRLTFEVKRSRRITTAVRLGLGGI